MRAFEKAQTQAAKATNRGDLTAAQHWIRLAERQLAVEERHAKLRTLELENDARALDVKRKARMEALIRQNRY